MTSTLFASLVFVGCCVLYTILIKIQCKIKDILARQNDVLMRQVNALEALSKKYSEIAECLNMIDLHQRRIARTLRDFPCLEDRDEDARPTIERQAEQPLNK